MHSYQFYRLFSRKMLYVEANHQHPRQAILQLFLQGFLLGGIVSVPKHPGCFQLFLLILYDMDSAKGYHTPKECGIFLWLNIILSDDTERSLVTPTDGIDFMTAQRTMEI